MADRPRWRNHRQAPQAAADPCRAHRLWRGRRQRSRRSRPVRYRPHRRAVLLGTSPTAVEIRHVCPERAGPCRGVAELFALRSLRAGARRRGQQRRLARLCGRGLMLRARALRNRVPSHDRRALRPARQERARSRRALFAARRDAAAAQQEAIPARRAVCAAGRHCRAHGHCRGGELSESGRGGLIMESAIPQNLEMKRTRHKRVPDDYQPPYPSFVARYKPAVSRVVMAYFGVQYRGAAADSLKEIARLFAAEGGPSHWDRAHYVDQAGYENVVSVAYWDDVACFDAWFASAREAWTGKAREGIGTFIEVLRPSVERHETLFSSLGRPEGVAVIADGMRGEVQEHAYWGGMRDRIPLSQTDAMAWIFCATTGSPLAATPTATCTCSRPTTA